MGGGKILLSGTNHAATVHKHWAEMGFHSLSDDECTRGRKEGRFDCITPEENVFFFTLPFSLQHREEERGEDSVFSYMIGNAFEPL